MVSPTVLTIVKAEPAHWNCGPSFDQALGFAAYAIADKSMRITTKRTSRAKVGFICQQALS